MIQTEIIQRFAFTMSFETLVKSNWGLNRHMQSSHIIQDLEEFDSLHKRLGKKSLQIILIPEYILIIFGLPL